LTLVLIGNDTTLFLNAIETLRTASSYKNYLWQDASTDTFAIIKTPGKYYLSCTDYCNTVSAATIVVKYDNPPLYSGQSVEVCQFETASIAANDGFINYQWQSANSIVGDSEVQRIEIKIDKSWNFIVSAETKSKCFIRDTINVVVNNCFNKIIVPNAFTPNNDGLNDKITAIVFGVLDKYSFYVYNRLGKLVFHSTNPKTGWDGKINAVGQDAGIYVWYCNYQFAGDTQKEGKR